MDTYATQPDDSKTDVSPVIAVALAGAAELSGWIFKHHPCGFKNARNHRLAAAHFAVCLEHREAALVLISENMSASAFALWRPTYENYMRGLWALNVAGEKAFQSLARTRAFPKFDTVIKELDRSSRQSRFGKTKAELWEPMSDFAHGGVTMLARWTGPDGIGSNHPEIEVRDLVDHLNIYGLLATMSVNYMAGDDGLPESVFEEKITSVASAIEGRQLAER